MRRLRNGVKVVVGPPAIESMSASMPALARSLAALEERMSTDVLVDVGIVRPGSPALEIAKSASRRIVVVRKEVDDLVALAHRRAALEPLGQWLVLTAGGRLRADDVARSIQWPVLADLLPHDRKSSAKLRATLARLSSLAARSEDPQYA
jgi:hypothetical protein